MAIKQLYVTSPFRYNTRMMQPGEPVQMTGPHQRLYLALGKVSTEKPKAAQATKPSAPTASPTAGAKSTRKRKAAKKTA